MSEEKERLTDPAYGRMMGSQSMQFFRGWLLLLGSMMAMMFIVLIGGIYAGQLYGILGSLVVAGLGLGGLGGGLAAYYNFEILIPTTKGMNLSMSIWETNHLAYGCWDVNEQPIIDIPFRDERERIMPVRIPAGIAGRKKSQSGEQELEVIQEIRTTTPDCGEKDCKCKFHREEFIAEYGQLYLMYPWLQFKTYAYIITPNPGTAPFRHAVLICPCPLNSLNSIQDLIFYKGFPVTTSTKFVCLSRVFEMDERNETYGGPCFILSFSSWHVEKAQQLSGFTTAFMVPNRERVIEIYNLWGIKDAETLREQLSTTRARVESLEFQLKDFQGQVFKTAWNIFASYLRTREMPRLSGKSIFSRKSVIAIIIGAVALALIAAYLLHVFG